VIRRPVIERGTRRAQAAVLPFEERPEVDVLVLHLAVGRLVGEAFDDDAPARPQERVEAVDLERDRFGDEPAGGQRAHRAAARVARAWEREHPSIANPNPTALKACQAA
jgi:hypothetical protein